jgi:ureidoglycolate hydrolase
VEESVNSTVQPLSAEAFQPFGRILERGQLIYPEIEEGRVVMELLRIKHRPHGKFVSQLAIHFSYNQTFIPVQGSMVLIVTPAPRNHDADPASYEFDYERTAAFVVEPS